MTYEHLLAPGRIGALETRNRIVMAPMGSNLCEADGTPGERMLAYYEARARGGVGLIVVEVAQAIRRLWSRCRLGMRLDV